MRGRYLLEAPVELLDAGKAHAKKEGVSFAQLLRTALGKEIGTERLAEPEKTETNRTASGGQARAVGLSGSVSPSFEVKVKRDWDGDNTFSSGPVPSLPAPKVERCGFRNPLVPAQKCALSAGHEGRHSFA